MRYSIVEKNADGEMIPVRPAQVAHEVMASATKAVLIGMGAAALAAFIGGVGGSLVPVLTPVFVP